MGDYDIKSVISNAYNISRQFYPGLKIPPNHENTNDATNIILKRGNDEIVAEMNVKTFESNDPVEEKEDENEFDESKTESEISSIESDDSNGISNA